MCTSSLVAMHQDNLCASHYRYIATLERTQVGNQTDVACFDLIWVKALNAQRNLEKPTSTVYCVDFR